MKEDTRYIFSGGELSKKDFSIKLKNEKGIFYIPVQDTKELYCMSDMSVSTKFFELAAKAGIVVHFFGYYENYIGTFYPKEQLISGRVNVGQVMLFQKDRMKIAKPIVSAIARNIHFVLYHYYRHGKKELKPFLDYLAKNVPQLIEKTSDIKRLLQIEGSVWQGFYENIKYILPPEFTMNKRVKRPPDNPMNALVSFGNSILYTKTISQIYHTHLNQSVSFLHEPSEGRFSLSLDLSEAFKPIIVFKTIFDCVNNRKLSVEKHFDKSMNYALLNESGRKVFIDALEARLNQTFADNSLKRRITYKQAIKLDGYRLIKTIIEDKPFKAFIMEENL